LPYGVALKGNGFDHKEEQALISSPTVGTDLPGRTSNAIDAILQITKEMTRLYR
jgi:hypothetical protein